MAANEDQLGVVEAFRDAAHRFRAVAAEHDYPRRPIRIELQFVHFDAPIEIQILVEIGANDHSGGRMDVRIAVAGACACATALGVPQIKCCA